MKTKLGINRNSEIRTGMLMLSPFLILFFVFTILPIISSVVLSFTSYDMISTPKFTGIGNYIKMFSRDDMFPKVLRNTLLLAVVTGPISYILAFMLAWMINELNRGMRTVLSFLFYAPALSGNVYLIWQVLFSGDSYGYINNAMLTMGLISEPIQWFKSPQYAMAIVMIVQLWMSMGVSFLANVSGLQNVNPELYEAGCIDGVRNRWIELWYITLPSMKSILLFGAVMQIQSCFSIGTLVTALTGFPSVNYSTDTMVTMLMDVGTSRYEMGYAAALSVFLFAMMAVTRVVVGKLLDSVGNQGGRR
ncbi:MAG: sugar ABC transporter permease [Clostridia bacterium]|nr:sugar ABC transporter permease [Clostridia bacterium]